MFRLLLISVGELKCLSDKELMKIADILQEVSSGLLAVAYQSLSLSLSLSLSPPRTTILKESTLFVREPLVTPSLSSMKEQ